MPGQDTFGERLEQMYGSVKFQITINGNHWNDSDLESLKPMDDYILGRTSASASIPHVVFLVPYSAVKAVQQTNQQINNQYVWEIYTW